MAVVIVVLVVIIVVVLVVVGASTLYCSYIQECLGNSLTFWHVSGCSSSSSSSSNSSSFPMWSRQSYGLMSNGY